eukprot:4356890-Alexandrium_andersonii.AAC.1
MPTRTTRRRSPCRRARGSRSTGRLPGGRRRVRVRAAPRARASSGGRRGDIRRRKPSPLLLHGSASAP